MRYDSEQEFELNFPLDKLQALGRGKSVEPCRISFLAEFSKALLKDAEAKQYPDLITFAFYCRKANLNRFISQHLNETEVRMGWGTCLHIAPANIPINFGFSFIMGFLAGNANIVRLPSKSFAQIDVFLRVYRQLVSQSQFIKFGESNQFIRTSRDSIKLIKLVNEVDALVVWGGDITVEHFRKLDKKPGCKEHYFPNRASSLIVNCDELEQLADDEFPALLEKFYNDTYLIDQAACSSPSMIFWYSQKQNQQIVKNKFFKQLNDYLENNYEFDTFQLLEKHSDIMKVCESLNSSISVEQVSPLIWLVNTDKPLSITPRLGTFIDKNISQLQQIPTQLRKNEQTISYWGFTGEEIAEQLINQNNVAIERISPLGEALNIGLIWDGKNMVDELSRLILIN